MRYHTIMLCGGESMMLTPSEGVKIDVVRASRILGQVMRASKDMVEFMYRNVKLTLYPNGSIMFYHFTDLEVACSYADEVIGAVTEG